MIRLAILATLAAVGISSQTSRAAPPTIDDQTDARIWKAPSTENVGLLHVTAVRAIDGIGEILDIGFEQPDGQPGRVVALGFNRVVMLSASTLKEIGSHPTPTTGWVDAMGWLRDLDGDGFLEAIMIRREGSERILTIDPRNDRPTRVLKLPDRPQYQRARNVQLAIVRGPDPEDTAIVIGSTPNDAATFIDLPTGTVREIDLPGRSFTQIAEIRHRNRTLALVARWQELSLLDHRGQIIATQKLDIRGHVINLRPLRNNHELFQSPELVQSTLYHRSPPYTYVNIDVTGADDTPRIELHEQTETWDNRAALFPITRPAGSVCHATIATVATGERIALISVWKPDGSVYRHALTGSMGMAAVGRISADARMISLTEQTEYDTLLVSWGDTLYKLRAND